MSRLPHRARMFIGAIVVISSALLAFVVASDDHFNVGITIVFSLLTLGAEQFPVVLPLGVGSYSVSFILTLAAIILAGPAEAGMVALFGSVTLKEVRRFPVHRHLFNASQLALATTLAGLTYAAIIGPPIGDGADMFPRVLLPVLGATAVNFLVNTGLVALVVALVQGGKLRAVWRTQYGGLATGNLAFAVLGVILALLYVEMGPASVLFVLVPLLVARNAFQSAVTLQGAYEATVKSLIKAIEAKDPYTSGHAERVARLAEMVAREYGLSAEQCRVIRFTALMHDVGKLGVSTKVLAKPGKLTPEEYEHMKIHPLRGYEIVSEIDFLREAAETAVRHHHERMDGGGYPDGLVGDQIPVMARIVMVCDAFDSMTSTRAYRPAKGIEDAIREIRRCAGTQFDQESLGALERALAKHGWEPAPEIREEQEEEARAPALAL